MKLNKVEIHQRQRTSSGILGEVAVARIKRLLKLGASKRELSEAYGVSIGAIRAIDRGDTWAWVQAEDEATPELNELATAASEVATPVPSTDSTEASRKRLEDLLRPPVGANPPSTSREQRLEELLRAEDNLTMERLLGDISSVRTEDRRLDEVVGQLKRGEEK